MCVSVSDAGEAIDLSHSFALSCLRDDARGSSSDSVPVLFVHICLSICWHFVCKSQKQPRLRTTDESSTAYAERIWINICPFFSLLLLVGLALWRDVTFVCTPKTRTTICACFDSLPQTNKWSENSDERKKIYAILIKQRRDERERRMNTARRDNTPNNRKYTVVCKRTCVSAMTATWLFTRRSFNWLFFTLSLSLISSSLRHQRRVFLRADTPKSYHLWILMLSQQWIDCVQANWYTTWHLTRPIIRSFSLSQFFHWISTCGDYNRSAEYRSARMWLDCGGLLHLAFISRKL